jgi:hypothetical protein
MPRRFYKLTSNGAVTGRWHLSEPTDDRGREVDDVWRFTEGRPVRAEGRLHVPLHRPGSPLDFTTTAACATPVVHSRIASVLTGLAPNEAQLLPVDVEAHPGPYFLLVATHLIRCIDESTCAEVLFWTLEDGQPENAWGWPVALIVSDDLKAALESTGATGMKFTEV